MGHLCHHPTCYRDVPPAMLACKTHWFQLPKRIRDRIWATYREGQEIDKKPSDDYSAAFDEAQEFWNAQQPSHPVEFANSSSLSRRKADRAEE